MIGRVVEVAEDGRHLSVYRGFMVVEENGAEIGRVPLDDIAVLVINAHGVSYTNTLITTLAIHGTAMVVCGNNFRPVAWLWPIDQKVRRISRRCRWRTGSAWTGRYQSGRDQQRDPEPQVPARRADDIGKPLAEFVSS